MKVNNSRPFLDSRGESEFALEKVADIGRILYLK